MPDPAERHRDLALLIVAGTVIALGVWLRMRQIGVPAGLSWDEHHFVENARNYLRHAPDWNDHPPLGKLLITQSIYLFGDHSVAWRLPSLLMGLASIALAGLLGASLFRSWRAGLCAAAFVAGDGFFIAYSRTALLDGVVATFVLAVACAVVRARRPWHVALASVLLGLGCAVKFNVVVMIVPIALVLFLPGRLPRWSALLILLAPLAYYAIYARGLALAHQAWAPADVVAETRKLWGHHAALTEMKHPLVSKWFTWLLPTKPITMRYSEAGGAVSAMTSMGNPLLWWAASVGVISTLITAASAALASVRRRLGREAEPWSPLRELDAASVWLVLFWCLPIVPWIVSRRDSYIYHYLPAYGFAVVLVAGRVSELLTARPRLGMAGAGLIAATTAWLAPVWSEIPISRAGYELRVWFPGWRRAPSRPARPPDKASLPGRSENISLPLRPMTPETVLDRLPDAVLVFRGRTVELCNAAARALWGRELVGAPSSELLAPGENERLEQFEKQRLEGWPLPDTIRARLAGPDGSIVTADVRVTFLEDDVRILCVRDVTEHTRAETLMGDLALLSSDAHLLDGPDALLDASAPVFDALGWTVALSEVGRTYSITRRIISPDGDPVGAYGRTLLDRRMPFAQTPVLAKVVRNKSGVFLDNVPWLLPGSERRASKLSESMTQARVARSAWCPVFQGRRVTHVIAVTGRDLSEHDFVAVKLFAAQLGAAAQLKRLRTEVVRSERLAAVGEMAAVLAHEVRNPLAIVFNALATLRRTTSEEERNQLIEILGDEAERLRRLASDLLDFSHPGTASPEAASLGPLVDAALEVARHDPAYAQRKPNVVVGGISGAHRAWVDPVLFGRALVNLFTNAFQHVPPGGEVSVTLAREADEAVIHVRNSGEPIPAEVAPRVFEPFFTTKPTGTGLGLAIVRRIAGDLGGSVELEPTDEGVSFALRVPAESSSSSVPPH